MPEKNTFPLNWDWPAKWNGIVANREKEEERVHFSLLARYIGSLSAFGSKRGTQAECDQRVRHFAAVAAVAPIRRELVATIGLPRQPLPPQPFPFLIDSF